jgi:hypothetical protein
VDEVRSLITGGGPNLRFFAVFDGMAPLSLAAQGYPCGTSVLPPFHIHSASESATEVERWQNGGMTEVLPTYPRDGLVRMARGQGQRLSFWGAELRFGGGTVTRQTGNRRGPKRGPAPSYSLTSGANFLSAAATHPCFVRIFIAISWFWWVLCDWRQTAMRTRNDPSLPRRLRGRPPCARNGRRRLCQRAGRSR